MAGDSPTAEYKDNFSYPLPGRSTPPPTTSYLSAKHEGQIDPAPTVSKPDKEDDTKEHKDKDKDEVDMSGPDANPGYKPEGEAKSEKPTEYKEDKSDVKMNGGDKLDTQFMLPLDAKDKDEDSDEESCTVNCLYYSMQCCECTIT